MNESRPLVPPEATRQLRPLGRLPFGFGPRTFVLLILGFLWVVPALWSTRMIAALILWDLLAVFAFVLDFFRLPPPTHIEVCRSWERAPSLATASPITLEIRNFGSTEIRCAVIDETPASLRDLPPALDLRVPRVSRASAQFTILPRTRGDVRMGRVFLRYQSRLGFAQRWAVADLSQKVRVLPDLEEARHHALYLIRSKQVEMEKRRRRQRGQGREFESLREYREGDDFRDICWTATARRHQLTARVFEIERSQAVWLVVDAGRLQRAEVLQPGSAFGLSKLDYAVNAALSIALVATQCGDRVGLIAYGRSVQQNLPAARGARHMRSMVESLAQVRGEASEADHSMAARLLLAGQHARSLVVWITDFAETPTLPEVIEYAMQIRRRHLVVFSAMSQPDLNAIAQRTPKTAEEMYRHAAALEIVHRRDLLLRGLRQQGVFAFEFVPGMLASSLVNQYLDIKERNLL
jgi:uncharacterized protein (DUF58 family)